MTRTILEMPWLNNTEQHPFSHFAITLDYETTPDFIQRYQDIADDATKQYITHTFQQTDSLTIDSKINTADTKDDYPSLNSIFTNLQTAQGGYDNLKKLEIKNLRDLRLLETLLATFTNLETLNLEESHSLRHLVFSASDCLSNIKKVNLSFSNISGKGLHSIFEHFPNLETIDLLSCERIADFTTLPDHVNLHKLKEITLSHSNISAAGLQTILEKAPNLEYISLSSCNNIRSLTDLPETVDLSGITEFEVSYSSMSGAALHSFLTKAPNLTKVSLSGCRHIADLTTLDGADLHKVRTLNCSNSNISDAGFTSFLEQAPNLEHLDATQCHNINDLNNLTNVHFNYLKHIKLHRSNISGQGLGNLLAQAPNAEMIDLHNCQNLNDLTALQNVDLSNVRHINLSGSNINSDGLAILLQQTQNLEYLNLENCNNIDSLNLSDTVDLHKLESLNLAGSMISGQGLKDILAKAPNLKHINLKGCLNIDDLTEEFEEEISLSHLKTLNLSESNIPKNGLKSFLTKAENLEDINLKYCEHLGILKAFHHDVTLQKMTTLNLNKMEDSNADIQFIFQQSSNLENLQLGHISTPTYERPEHPLLTTLSTANLSNLRRLNFHNINVSGEQLQHILENAPQLEYLNLGSCKHLGDLKNLSEQSLKHLTCAKLNYSSISGESLKTILEQAHKLEIIELSGCPGIGSLNQLADHANLSSIKELTLQGSNISGNGVKAMLAKATNVEAINLLYCKNIGDLTDLTEETNLHRVTDLDLDYSNISGAGVKAILEKTPHIQNLNLRHCQHIQDLTDLSDIDLTQLTTLNLQNSNISTKGLETILKQAPNLEEINLNGCHIDDFSIIVKADLKHLKTLKISDSNISDEVLKTILENTPNLKTIELDHCHGITDLKDFTHHHLGKIEHLGAHKSGISDAGVKVILENATNMQYLDLTECRNIQTRSILAFSERGVTQLRKKLHITPYDAKEDLVQEDNTVPQAPQTSAKSSRFSQLKQRLKSSTTIHPEQGLGQTI